eukprot:196835_1
MRFLAPIYIYWRNLGCSINTVNALCLVTSWVVWNNQTHLYIVNKSYHQCDQLRCIKYLIEFYIYKFVQIIPSNIIIALLKAFDKLYNSIVNISFTLAIHILPTPISSTTINKTIDCDDNKHY